MKIGFIGGGQLCRLTALENIKKNLGHEIIALDPVPNCPASEFISRQIVGDLKCPKQILELAKSVDVITYEIESGNAEVLADLETNGTRVCPSPETLAMIQDKFIQKSFLAKNGIQVPKFVEIKSLEGLERAMQEFSYPAVLKATRDSFDGRGNFIIENESQLKAAYEAFPNRELILEEFVSLTKEISILVARSLNGSLSIFSPSENVHKDSILHMSVFPAKLSAEVYSAAIDLANKVLPLLKGAGLFCIEMFVDKDDSLYVNEIAPRVHNSGHHTIEACKTSQFEQHLLAITGDDLGSTDVVSEAVMLNILGPDSFEGEYKVVVQDKLPENAFLHMYQKKESRPQRKIGHLTVLGSSIDEAKELWKKVLIVEK